MVCVELHQFDEARREVDMAYALIKENEQEQETEKETTTDKGTEKGNWKLGERMNPATLEVDGDHGGEGDGNGDSKGDALPGWLVVDALIVRRQVLAAQHDYDVAKDVAVEAIECAERVFGRGSPPATNIILEFVDLVLVAGEIDHEGQNHAHAHDGEAFNSELMQKSRRANLNRANEEKHYEIALDHVG